MNICSLINLLHVHMQQNLESQGNSNRVKEWEMIDRDCC